MLKKLSPINIFINGGFCMETRLVCFLIKMATEKKAFSAWLLSNFLPQFLFSACLENYGESKLKVFNMIFRTFFKLSYDKARYFYNVFGNITLLPSSCFCFYKFKVAKLLAILSQALLLLIQAYKPCSVQRPPFMKNGL